MLGLLKSSWALLNSSHFLGEFVQVGVAVDEARSEKVRFELLVGVSLCSPMQGPMPRAREDPPPSLFDYTNVERTASADNLLPISHCLCAVFVPQLA